MNERRLKRKIKRTVGATTPKIPSDNAVTSWDSSYYIIEALLYESIQNPKWCNVRKTAINGWDDEEGVRWRLEGYAFTQFWNDVLAWVDEDAAKAAFARINGYKQKYRLRLVRYRTVRQGLVLKVNSEPYAE